MINQEPTKQLSNDKNYPVLICILGFYTGCNRTGHQAMCQKEMNSIGKENKFYRTTSLDQNSSILKWINSTIKQLSVGPNIFLGYTL